MEALTTSSEKAEQLPVVILEAWPADGRPPRPWPVDEIDVQTLSLHPHPAESQAAFLQEKFEKVCF